MQQGIETENQGATGTAVRNQLRSSWTSTSMHTKLQSHEKSPLLPSEDISLNPFVDVKLHHHLVRSHDNK